MNILESYRRERGLSFKRMSTLVPYGATAIWKHCRMARIPTDAALIYSSILGIPLSALRPDLDIHAFQHVDSPLEAHAQ